MKGFCIRTTLCLVAVLAVASCSDTPAELVVKHTRRGDEFVQKEKFKEAVIEYKNAAKAAPDDARVRWKLAKAALDAKDFRTAYLELQKTTSLDPGNYEALGLLGEIYLAAGKTADARQIADNILKGRPQDPEGYILKSGIAVRSGQTDEAIRQLKKAVELDPKKTKTILNVGGLYHLKGDPKAAREWYDKALSIDPGSVDVHVARGNFFFASGDREEGEKEYRKAIELSKEKENIRIALAEHYLFQNRIEESEKELNAVIKDMNSQKARKVLAEIRIETRKLPEAKTIVDEILKENAKDLDGKFLKGRIALAEKRLDDAKALLGEVVKLDAAMGRARLYNGIADIQQGHIEMGRKEVLEAVKLEPWNIRARLVLGGIYLNTNAPVDAEKQAVEVLRKNPANVEAAVLYADSFLLRREWKKAEQVYLSMIRQIPKSPIGYFKMGLSKKMQKMPAEAAGYFQQAVERNPKDLIPINEYIFSLAAAKRTDRAKAVLDDCIAKDPKNPLLREIAGRLHLASGKEADAEAAFLKAIELAPEFPEPYYRLGILYASQKKLPEAESKFRKVVEKNARNAGAFTMLGVVQNSQGKMVEANKSYRKALEITPKNTLAANNLASNLADFGGNLDEALKFAQNARESAPEDPNVADTLGWIYYKKGLNDTAFPLIEDASRKLKGNASVRYHYGMALAKKGKTREAAAELKAALALDSRFHGAEEARKSLASLK